MKFQSKFSSSGKVNELEQFQLTEASHVPPKERCKFNACVTD
jgi:hypothetical protein